MRNISLRILFLFIATAVFVSPLVAMVDKFCRCPDCTQGTCFVKSMDCTSGYRSEEVSPCCGQDAAVSKTPSANQYPVGDSNAAEPNHKSRAKSKDCCCSIYMHYDGNSILPITNSILSPTIYEFYQRIPKIFATSAWVYQIFHPPR